MQYKTGIWSGNFKMKPLLKLWNFFQPLSFCKCSYDSLSKVAYLTFSLSNLDFFFAKSEILVKTFTPPTIMILFRPNLLNKRVNDRWPFSRQCHKRMHRKSKFQTKLVGHNRHITGTSFSDQFTPHSKHWTRKKGLLVIGEDTRWSRDYAGNCSGDCNLSDLLDVRLVLWRMPKMIPKLF